MIVTQKKPWEAVLKMLEGYQHVFIVGCGDCATTCHTGGEPEVQEMAQKLSQAGKTVTGWAVPENGCVAAKIKLALAKHRSALKQSQAFLVMSCGSGTQAMKENDREGLAVFPANDTLFATVVDGAGNFLERCSACGECLLALTGGICPLTLCAKGILNGPCGGMNKGKCEVDKDKDCAWVLIYKELQSKNKLSLMKEKLPPKDYSRIIRPRKIAAPA